MRSWLIALLCAGLLSLWGCENRVGDALRAVTVIDPDSGMELQNDPTGDIAISEANVNTIYVSYCDYTDKDLKFAKSTDQGETWPAASIVTVDAPGNVGEASKLFLSANSVRIIYFENYKLSGQVRKCAESTDGGATWTLNAIVDPPNTGELRVFSMIFIAETLYCFYSTNDAFTRRLRCATSSDRGTTWEAPVEITTYASDPRNEYARYCAVLNPVSRPLLFLYSWTNELTIARSTDGGATWPVGDLDTISPAGEMITGGLSALVSASSISLVYGDSSNNDIRLLRSENGGESWPTESLKVAEYENNVGFHLFAPYIESLGLLLTGGNWFSSLASFDEGATWSDPSLTEMENPIYIAGAADSGTIYVLGSFSSNESTMLGLIMSSDGGYSWY